MIAELDTLKRTIIIKSSFTLYELTDFIEQHMVQGWVIELAKEYIYYPNQPYVQPYTYTPYAPPPILSEPWTITCSNGFTGSLSTNGFVGTNTAIGKEQ